MIAIFCADYIEDVPEAHREAFRPLHDMLRSMAMVGYPGGIIEEGEIIDLSGGAVGEVSIKAPHFGENLDFQLLSVFGPTNISNRISSQNLKQQLEHSRTTL